MAFFLFFFFFSDPVTFLQKGVIVIFGVSGNLKMWSHQAEISPKQNIKICIILAHALFFKHFISIYTFFEVIWWVQLLCFNRGKLDLSTIIEVYQKINKCMSENKIQIKKKVLKTNHSYPWITVYRYIVLSVILVLIKTHIGKLDAVMAITQKIIHVKFLKYT